MGTSKCGKSTTIQYLCGSEMYPTMINGLNHIGFRNVKNNDLLMLKCSPFARSETRYIKRISYEHKSKYGSGIKVTFVDSPGLIDT